MIRFWILVIKRKIHFRIQECGFGFSPKNAPLGCVWSCARAAKVSRGLAAHFRCSATHVRETKREPGSQARHAPHPPSQKKKTASYAGYVPTHIFSLKLTRLIQTTVDAHIFCPSGVRVVITDFGCVNLRKSQFLDRFLEYKSTSGLSEQSLKYETPKRKLFFLNLVLRLPQPALINYPKISFSYSTGSGRVFSG